MTTFRQFAHSVRDSFYNPAFYKRIRNRRLSRSVLLLLGIFSFSVLVWLVRITLTVVPLVGQLSSGELVDLYYPDGVVLTARNNTFSSNVDEPYVIPLTQKPRGGDSIQNAVVISTKEDLTLGQIAAFDSLAVITKTGVVAQGDRGELRAFSLAQAGLGDFVVDEAHAREWSTSLADILKIAYVPLALLGGAIGLGFMLATHLVLLLLGALVVLAVASFKRVKLSYRQAYSTALYAIVPILALDFVLLLFSIAGFPLLYVLLFVIIVSVNVCREDTSAMTGSHIAAKSPDA